MKIAVCYVYPLIEANRYFVLANRFADTYRYVPSGYEHELHVLKNGGNPNHAGMSAFSGVSHIPHNYDNTGWDVGAFQKAAVEIPCDLLVCLGAPVHFHKPNWLAFMAEAYIQNGPALYGCWAYLSPNWHVRTTCFWCPPELLNAYPIDVGSSRRSRYDFEHGNNSLTRFALKAGLECLMVTRNGIFPFSQWQDHAPGVEESLVLDQHIHRP